MPTGEPGPVAPFLPEATDVQNKPVSPSYGKGPKLPVEEVRKISFVETMQGLLQKLRKPKIEQPQDPNPITSADSSRAKKASNLSQSSSTIEGTPPKIYTQEEIAEIQKNTKIDPVNTLWKVINDGTFDQVDLKSIIHTRPDEILERIREETRLNQQADSIDKFAPVLNILALKKPEEILNLIQDRQDLVPFAKTLRYISLQIPDPDRVLHLIEAQSNPAPFIEALKIIAPRIPNETLNFIEQQHDLVSLADVLEGISSKIPDRVLHLIEAQSNPAPFAKALENIFWKKPVEVMNLIKDESDLIPYAEILRRVAGRGEAIEVLDLIREQPDPILFGDVLDMIAEKAPEQFIDYVAHRPDTKVFLRSLMEISASSNQIVLEYLNAHDDLDPSALLVLYRCIVEQNPDVVFGYLQKLDRGNLPELSLEKKNNFQRVVDAERKILVNKIISRSNSQEHKNIEGILGGELTLRWNQILPSLLNSFEKLKKLGYIYSNGEVFIIEPEKEERHV